MLPQARLVPIIATLIEDYNTLMHKRCQRRYRAYLVDQPMMSQLSSKYRKDSRPIVGIIGEARLAATRPRTIYTSYYNVEAP